MGAADGADGCVRWIAGGLGGGVGGIVRRSAVAAAVSVGVRAAARTYEMRGHHELYPQAFRRARTLLALRAG